MKKNVLALLIVFLVVALPLAWYLIAPAFQVVEVEEASPLADSVVVVNEEALAHMDAVTKEDFHNQMESMKDVVIQSTQEGAAGAVLVSQGDFKPRAHEVEGKALLIDDTGKQVIRFEDFDTINGPNLHIYLSADVDGDDFIDLGKIKATKGSVNYDVPPGTDLDKYNKVLVWCVPFKVLFSYAELV